MPRLTKYRKTLFKLRDDVHKYLDGIWLVSSKKHTARNAMYTWLATQMNLTREEAHVSKFDISRCQEAIKILKPKYIQLYGKDINEEVEDMYYLNKSFNVKGTFSLSRDNGIVYAYDLKITVFCKSQKLNDDGMVQDYDQISSLITNNLLDKYVNDVFSLNPTYENIARWICEQIITAYKVQVEDHSGNIVIFEESEN